MYYIPCVYALVRYLKRLSWQKNHKNRQTTLASSWCTSWTPPTATRPPSGDPIDFTCSVARVFSATSFILEIELELLCAIRQRLNKRTKGKTGLRRPSKFHTFITSRSPVKDLCQKPSSCQSSCFSRENPLRSTTFPRSPTGANTNRPAKKGKEKKSAKCKQEISLIKDLRNRLNSSTMRIK